MRFKAVVTLLALLCLAELIKYCTCIVVKPALALARPKREKLGGNSIKGSIIAYILVSLTGRALSSLTPPCCIFRFIKTRMQTVYFIGLLRSAAKMIKAEGLQGLVQGVSAVARGTSYRGQLNLEFMIN